LFADSYFWFVIKTKKTHSVDSVQKKLCQIIASNRFGPNPRHATSIDYEYAIVKHTKGKKFATIVGELATNEGFTRTTIFKCPLTTEYFPLKAIAYIWANKDKWKTDSYRKFPEVKDDAVLSRHPDRIPHFVREWTNASAEHLSKRLLPQITIPAHYLDRLAPYQKAAIEHVNLWRDPAVSYYHKMPHMCIWGPSNSGKTSFLRNVILHGLEEKEVLNLFEKISKNE
jgi:hypothetical protein